MVGPTLVVPSDKVMAQGWDNSTASTAKVVGPALVVPTDKVMAQGWDNSAASTAEVVRPTLVVPTDKVKAQVGIIVQQSWLVQRW